MPMLNRFTRQLWDLDTFYVFNDFEKDQVDTDWVDTVTDTGTVAIGDEVGGVVTLTPSDGTVADNDEVYLATANELFKYGANMGLYGRFRIQFTETTAGIYNCAVGFMNAVGADSIVDNTGLPKASGSTLAIYKTDGSQVWKCCSAVNGTATHTTSTKSSTKSTSVGGGWQELEIEATPTDSLSYTVTFSVDGEKLRDSSGLVIRHNLAFASATEMQMFIGAKLGAATNNDVLKCDYAYGAQRRTQLVP
jgi:hypothetical protein